MMEAIVPVTVPMWGLTMEEGTVVEWLIDEGESITPGTEIVEIETSKIVNVVEAQEAGTLQRIIATPGDTLPVGGLLGILTTGAVEDADIDAFISAWQASVATREAAETGESNKPRYATIDGQDIFYTMAGSLENGTVPVVLVHGFGGDADSWMFNLDALAADHPVFAMDLPGHGRSSKILRDGAIDSLATCVSGFLDFIDAPQAHLVGHSLGGAIVAEVARQRNERVASLTLIAPAGFADTINRDFIHTFSRANSRRELKAAMTLLFADSDVVTRELLDRTLRTLRIDGVRQALQLIEASCFADGRQASRYDTLIEQIDTPVLIITGEKDQVIPAPESGQPVIITGAGHMPQMEAAGEVNRIILEHIGG